MTEHTDQWHLKREVPIATILTVIAAISAGSFWMADLRGDVDLHWQAFTQHVEQQSVDEGRREQVDREILDELKALRVDITELKISLAKRGNK